LGKVLRFESKSVIRCGAVMTPQETDIFNYYRSYILASAVITNDSLMDQLIARLSEDAVLAKEEHALFRKASCFLSIYAMTQMDRAALLAKGKNGKKVAELRINAYQNVFRVVAHKDNMSTGIFDTDCPVAAWADQAIFDDWGFTRGPVEMGRDGKLVLIE